MSIILLNQVELQRSIIMKEECNSNVSIPLQLHKVSSDKISQYYSIMGKPQIKKNSHSMLYESGVITAQIDEKNNEICIVNSYHSMHHLITRLEVKIGNFSHVVYVLNIQEDQSPIHNIQKKAQTVNGTVFTVQSKLHAFQVKSIKFTNAVSFLNAIKEYLIFKICSILKIGPSLCNFYGFDFINYGNCIEFSYQKCQNIQNTMNINDSLLQSLRQMHELSIVHCNITADNIKWSKQFDKPVFTDFSFAKVIKEQIGFKSLTGLFTDINTCSQQMLFLLEKGQQQYIDLYFYDAASLHKSLQTLQMKRDSIHKQQIPAQKREISSLNYTEVTYQKVIRYYEGLLVKYHLYQQNFEEIKRMLRNAQKPQKIKLIRSMIEAHDDIVISDNLEIFYNFQLAEEIKKIEEFKFLVKSYKKSKQEITPKMKLSIKNTSKFTAIYAQVQHLKVKLNDKCIQDCACPMSITMQKYLTNRQSIALYNKEVFFKLFMQFNSLTYAKHPSKIQDRIESCCNFIECFIKQQQSLQKLKQISNPEERYTEMMRICIKYLIAYALKSPFTEWKSNALEQLITHSFILNTFQYEEFYALMKKIAKKYDQNFSEKLYQIAKIVLKLKWATNRLDFNKSLALKKETLDQFLQSITKMCKSSLNQQNIAQFVNFVTFLYYYTFTYVTSFNQFLQKFRQISKNSSPQFKKAKKLVLQDIKSGVSIEQKIFQEPTSIQNISQSIQNNDLIFYEHDLSSRINDKRRIIRIINNFDKQMRNTYLSYKYFTQNRVTAAIQQASIDNTLKILDFLVNQAWNLSVVQIYNKRSFAILVNLISKYKKYNWKDLFPQKLQAIIEQSKKICNSIFDSPNYIVRINSLPLLIQILQWRLSKKSKRKSIIALILTIIQQFQSQNHNSQLTTVQQQIMRYRAIYLMKQAYQEERYHDGVMVFFDNPMEESKIFTGQSTSMNIQFYISYLNCLLHHHSQNAIRIIICIYDGNRQSVGNMEKLIQTQFLNLFMNVIIGIRLLRYPHYDNAYNFLAICTESLTRSPNKKVLIEFITQFQKFFLQIDLKIINKLLETIIKQLKYMKNNKNPYMALIIATLARQLLNVKNIKPKVSHYRIILDAIQILPSYPKMILLEIYSGFAPSKKKRRAAFQNKFNLKHITKKVEFELIISKKMKNITNANKKQEKILKLQQKLLKYHSNLGNTHEPKKEEDIFNSQTDSDFDLSQNKQA